ncbi:class I SAM-dependent methyltransferase [Nibricoccus sp. IMCC34717]|uniref:class I SAM-dependent methyltransferase n=1 Tax=Nibricoccus sp. IMCC34717 TaxID=3034021 RepID=UPI00384ECD65
MNSTSTVAPTSLDAATRQAPLAERLVLDEFALLRRGRLHLHLPDGSTRTFGEGATGPLPEGVANEATLVVRRPSFFSRCILGGDIGFAEAYLDGDWDTPDITAVISWFILNVEASPTLSGSRRRTPLALNLLRFANRLGHLLRANSRARARRNIHEHYDLSNDFFSLFLDPETMMYSSALWPTNASTSSPSSLSSTSSASSASSASSTSSLSLAQHHKNDALCRSLRLSPSDHVLEIGSGWGGWAIHAARHYGCRVTSLTLSEQQLTLARERIAAAGLSDRIEVRLQDYRDVRGEFDKLVSIEMLEAVGHAYQPDYFRACARLVKPRGLIALQFITCPDARYSAFRKGVDFIQKHIFPGSLLLSLNRVNGLLAEHGGFSLVEMRDFGPDYARTLRLWRERFRARLDEVRALGFDDRFIRKWDYYLCYCEAAFALRNISVVHTLHSRPNNLSL